MQTFINIFCSLALTKLDVLDDFDEVKIGIAYELDGTKNYDSFPGDLWKQFQNMFNSLDVYYAIKIHFILMINKRLKFL